MNWRARELQYIFHSQAFADGVRTTAAILLPSIGFGSIGLLNVGMTISLGALCVSLTDAPGPVTHKRNGMLFCVFFIFIITLVTAIVRLDVFLMGVVIAVVSFVFSMFNIYGNRASGVGSAVILVMILTMDKPVQPGVVLEHSLLIMFGGLWYMSISLLFHNLQPYRSSQRILGDCIREVASYLSIKANFYNPDTDLAHNYRQLVSQQVIVNEKQDAVREILFKTRQIVKETTWQGRRLVWTFVETVDLFEDITAIYYDYASLRNRYAGSGILLKISAFINEISNELDQLGLAIQLNGTYHPATGFEKRLTGLKEDIDALGKTDTESNLVLRKILVNIRRLVQRYEELNNYFIKEGLTRERPAVLDHSHFITHQPLDLRTLWINLTLQSAVFRHSMRVMIGCIAGYSVAKLIAYGEHSYWILLTIAFIIKPAFSLTKQRNIERIIGTLIGGIAGILIVVFIDNRNALFVLMVLFMIATYSFMRVNYLAMVLCVTPFVLILFTFLGMPFLDVAKERIGDTIAGCAIAFSASYFLFPTWEHEQVKTNILQMLKANAAYLEIIVKGLSGQPIPLLDYKLARKEVYVNSANLAAGFQRMLSEPKNKQKNREQVHQFVVLNHILFSNFATLATGIKRKEPRLHPHQLVVAAKKSLNLLYATIRRSEENTTASYLPEKQKEQLTEGMETVSPDDVLLKDQLDFIYKLMLDIDKTTAVIFSEGTTVKPAHNQ